MLRHERPTCYGGGASRDLSYRTNYQLATGGAVRGLPHKQPICYGGDGARHVFYNKRPTCSPGWGGGARHALYYITGPPAAGEALRGMCFIASPPHLIRGERGAARVLRHKRPTCYGGGGARHVFYDINGHLLREGRCAARVLRHKRPTSY